MEYFLSNYSNNILNVFAFFGDAGVTCREYTLSVQKETTERGFDRKKSVTDIHRAHGLPKYLMVHSRFLFNKCNLYTGIINNIVRYYRGLENQSHTNTIFDQMQK